MEFLLGFGLIMLVFLLLWPRQAAQITNRRLADEGRPQTATEGQAGCITGLLILGIVIFVLLAVANGGL